MTIRQAVVRDELVASLEPVTTTLLATVNENRGDYTDTIMVQATSPFFDFEAGHTVWGHPEPVADFKRGSIHTSNTHIIPCNDSNLHP